METDLRALWGGLSLPSRDLTAIRHPASSDVWIGTDEVRRRHLLVKADVAEPGTVLFEARGLRASFETLTLEGERTAIWADIVCLEPALNDTFVSVAESLVAEVRRDPEDLVGAVTRTLRTWQWFWGIDPTAMSISSALGLFGELWFLDRWTSFPDGVTAWVGPTGARHDFVSPSISVECKATRVRSDGPSAHRISHLDQLDDPESGALYLFSLQAVADENAGNSLPKLVERVRSRCAARPDLLALLDQRLGEANWTPAAGEHHRQTYRVVAEELYEVSTGFPRIVRSTFVDGIPEGVDGISYSLNLAACAPWKRAQSPGEARRLLEALSA